jgi:hypothetical protein
MNGIQKRQQVIKQKLYEKFEIQNFNKMMTKTVVPTII